MMSDSGHIRTRFCDGIARRDLLTIGNAALFGSAWHLPGILQSQAHAAERLAAGHGGQKDDVSLIVVFLLVYYGTTSEQLTEWMTRRAAPVKLGTAVLFALLAGWLGYSIIIL